MARAGNGSLPELGTLRSPADFRRVLRKGVRRRAGGVVMVKHLGESGVARVGLVVPKSAGNAVVRNRIRRRLRHSLRMVPLKAGTDYVIIADEQVAQVAQPELIGWLTYGLGDPDA